MKLTKVLAFTAAAGVLATMAPLAAAQTTAPLTCSPSSVTTNVGQSVVLTAAGGNTAVAYTWSVPNTVLNNPTGNQFTVTFTTPGTRVVTLSNGSLSATCTVFVNDPAPAPVPAPGVPNTGNAGSDLGLMLMVIAASGLAAVAANKLAPKPENQ